MMKIYREQNLKDEFINVVNELIKLTQKLRSYCTSDEAYSLLLNDINKEGR